jgi:hypothetical protein
MPLQELADKIELARSIVTDVNSGAIFPKTVINKFLRVVSPLVRKDASALRELIAQAKPSAIGEAVAFKAKQAPNTGKPRTWSEAVEASDMPDDRKAYWLSEDD